MWSIINNVIIRYRGPSSEADMVLDPALILNQEHVLMAHICTPKFNSYNVPGGDLEVNCYPKPYLV